MRSQRVTTKIDSINFIGKTPSLTHLDYRSEQNLFVRYLDFDPTKHLIFNTGITLPNDQSSGNGVFSKDLP